MNGIVMMMSVIVMMMIMIKEVAELYTLPCFAPNGSACYLVIPHDPHLHHHHLPLHPHNHPHHDHLDFNHMTAQYSRLVG